MRLRIEKAVYGGSGLARADGKAIFVPLSLPGEEVEAAIVTDKGGFATAELQSVIERSPARIDPSCPYFGRCGGCHYQHASYTSQIEMKIAILRESLERAHIADIPAITPVIAAPFGYRNRIRLHVRKNPFSLGYKVRNSHDHLPVDTCPIAAPLLQRALQVLNRDGALLNLDQFATEVELFTDATESSLLLSLWTDRPQGVGPLCDKIAPVLGRVLPEFQGIDILAASHRKGVDRSIAHRGAEMLRYSVANRTYRVSLNSFFQVNRFLIDSMIAIVSSGETGAIAWDLYAGVGLFSVPLADTFSQVVAVESSASAVRDLRENLRGAGHRAVAADTVAFLREAVNERLPTPDLVVVDPPRAGLGREVATILGRIRPRNITYVSCDPATLSRDLATLVQSGYRLKRMHLLDLFPQTFHLESITHLLLE